MKIKCKNIKCLAHFLARTKGLTSVSHPHPHAHAHAHAHPHPHPHHHHHDQHSVWYITGIQQTEPTLCIKFEE